MPTLAAPSFSIPANVLALTPYEYPTITKEDAKRSLTVSTKRKNRYRGIGKVKTAKVGLHVSVNERTMFKKVCRANGKGMSEVLNAFMVAYTEKAKCDILNRVLG